MPNDAPLLNPTEPTPPADPAPTPPAEPAPADPAPLPEDPQPTFEEQLASRAFVDLLPESLKNDPTLSRFKTLEDQVNSHKELRAKMGDAVNIPKEDATEQEISDFYSKLGRPEKHQEYVLDVPEGASIPEGTLNWFSEVAWSLGLSKAQAEAQWKQYIEFETSVQMDKQNNEARNLQEATESLQREWGSNFNAKLETANRMFQSEFPQEVQDLLISKGVHNHPEFIKSMFEWGDKVREDSTDGTHTTRVTQTLQSLEAEQKELMKDYEAYWKDPVKQARMKEISDILANMSE